MKWLNWGVSGLLACGLLASCVTSKSSEPKKEDVEVKETMEEKKAKIDPKEWKIVPPPPELEKPNFEANAKEWVALRAKEFSQVSTDPNENYAKAESASHELDTYIRFTVEGIDIQKDLENLHSLGGTIGHLNYMKSEQEKQGIGAAETITQLDQAYKYMSEILHDLDIIMNHGGKGETFGVTHQLNGENTSKLEAFYMGDD
ncbi:hypothetical protein R4Z09_14080 [Niallia oryzisoli]|uniref:Lipoprotein n=1 Tax=Niallia oryzisoli TaxID=1737571 RepID=A0ABZ2CJQ4_9BACI